MAPLPPSKNTLAPLVLVTAFLNATDPNAIGKFLGNSHADVILFLHKVKQGKRDGHAHEHAWSSCRLSARGKGLTEVRT